MSKPIQWVRQWGMTLHKTSLPGVYKNQTGGHYVRARIVNPKTGVMEAIEKSLDTDDARQAFAWLQSERSRLKDGMTPERKSKPRFATYAVSVFERKVKTSAATPPMPCGFTTRRLGTPRWRPGSPR